VKLKVPPRLSLEILALEELNGIIVSVDTILVFGRIRENIIANYIPFISGAFQDGCQVHNNFIFLGIIGAMFGQM
jgi:hypothetical protein